MTSQGLTRRGTLKLASGVLAGTAMGAGAALARSDALAAAFSVEARTFEAAARAEGVVGASLGFKAPGRDLMHHHFGLADIETDRSARLDTLYHWASITKTVTAIGAMQLVERGLIQLDAPVTAYLPETRAIHNPFGSIEDMKVSHLLRHSSGLREGTWPWRGDGDGEGAPYEPPGWTQLEAMMPYTELMFAPGSRYSYSNPGTTFMGRIIEVVMGEPVEVYLDKNVLKPLGMSRSYFDLTPWHLRRFRSNSYAIGEDGARRVLGLEFDTGVTVANGGLNAPITDMALYLDFLAGGGDPEVSETILPRATLEAMWVPAFPTDYDDTIEEHMASSFFTIDCPAADGRAQRFIGHTGSQKGFRSFIYVHPPSQAWTIMATNTTAPSPRPLLFRTRRRLFSDVFPLAAAR